MPWLHHPRYCGLRDNLIREFKARTHRFERLNKIVFLCGKQGPGPRDALDQYLRRTAGGEVSAFYADYVWARIAREDTNALEMENRLASISDMVVIVVESPGTFAELGAFSQSEDLRKKLLPILDGQYRGCGSFLETGPLRWIEKESAFAPAIYTDLQAILTCGDELEDRLRRIPRRHSEETSDLAKSPKHLLFLLCDLVTMIGPVTADHVEHYVFGALDSTPSVTTKELLELAAALRLIATRSVRNGAVFYLPLADPEQIVQFRKSQVLDIAFERAKFLSVLQLIPEWQALLQELEGGLC